MAEDTQISGTLINLNFDQVPDVVPQIPNGLYTMKINSAKINPPETKPDGTVKHAQVECELEMVDSKIITVGNAQADIKGRKLRDWTSVKMDTRLKRLFKSAGVEVGANGADVNQLVGRQVRVTVVNTISDKNGVKREFPNIQDFLIPGDQGYNA